VGRIERDHAASELPHVANTVSPVAHETYNSQPLMISSGQAIVSRMAAYAALSAPQLQFSAGPARFFFQAHPNSLKLLDEFRFRQAGVSERRTFSFYLNRASLVEHILRERDLFECNLVPPPAGAVGSQLRQLPECP